MSLSQHKFDTLLSKAKTSSDKSVFLKELAPYKVDNAIILAAGLSTRFAPLSYDRPKGLLSVKGEVLIERQIMQLQEAGIKEIYVVVGYKRELFFYLEDKFGVTLVYNPDFASKNNVSSMWVVRDKLKNSYICSADNYFDTNPFEAYVYRPYYLAQYSKGPTAEWIMHTNEAGLIEEVHVGGDSGWFMVGEAYFDRAFSAQFREILEAVYENPETAKMLWEDLYIQHMDELSLYIKKNPANSAHEFDSLDELISFDPLFLQNVNSKIFDNICDTLGCSQTEIHDVYPLTLSLTNVSFHFATNTGEYVYRHPGIGTEDIIDRKNEKRALELAKEAGFDRTYVYANAEEGWKISHFVKDTVAFDPHDPADIQKALHVCQKLHASPITLTNTFDFYQEAKRYEKLIAQKNTSVLAEYSELASLADTINQYVQKDGAPKTVNHNDFFSLNFLVEKDGTFNVIDWEYAGMGDYANDLATFCVCCELSQDEIDNVIKLYFDGKATPSDYRHVYGVIGLSGWCWYLWSILKECDGDNVGKWLYTYYKYAKRYIKLALDYYTKQK